ncbi:MAG: SPOR domain-containing protein [Planctomycetota bacterium]|nr:SPOR domain-containing protein [Planctomycetota bacterium]
MPRYLFVLSALLLLVACESTPASRSPLTLASARYEAGDFDRARDLAEPLLSQGQPQSDEAAWIVGLCDYRQERLNNARKQFRFITSSSDLALSAQARVMLAQIDLAEGHPSLSLASLARAWPDLPAQHQRRAAELAVAAAQALNDTQAEDRWLARMPAAPSRTTPAIAAIRDRYTLQAGAYRNRSGAEQVQFSLNKQDTPLGDAMIRTRTDRRGQTLYLVQIGSFTTRAAANAARGHVTDTDLVVVAQ